MSNESSSMKSNAASLEGDPNLPSGGGDEFETRPEDRVPLGEKMAYGSGFLANFFGGAAIKQWAQNYYNMFLFVDPVKLGAVLAIPRIWDAITDPVAGYISDNIHTRFGRRKPFIIAGAILQAIVFGMIWMVPQDYSEHAKLVYLLSTLLVFYTCFTIFSVPLITLGYEMTADYHERTRIAVFPAAFSKGAEMIYSYFMPFAQLAIFGTVVYGVHFIGWTVAIVIMGLVATLPGVFVKERYYKKAKKQKKIPFWKTCKDCVQSKPFIVLMLLTVLQILAGIFASSLDQYVIVYYMFEGDKDLGLWWKAYLSSSYAIVGVLSIFPIKWMANKYDKVATLRFFYFLVLLGAYGKWALYSPGNEWKMLFDSVLCGPVWMAIAILTPSMMGDICDEDELKHGLRREGMYGAFFSWFTKTGWSLAFLGSGVALNWSGFQAELGGNQSPDAIFRLRSILAGSTAIWAIVAIWILGFYPITKKRAYATRDALEARRGKITD